MKTMHRRFLKRVVVLSWAALFILILMPGSLLAQSIVEDWDTVKAPQAPELKTVTLEPATTALLLLDFNKQTCNANTRPRCISSIPAVAGLLNKARAHGAKVIFSLSPGAAVTDIAKELTPVADEPVVTSGPDKFMGTDLEKIIRERGVKTVIVTGTAAHGAVIYTASGAALRGIKVIIPVDGMSAENTYAEQYTVWHLVNAPRVSNQVTLTKISSIKF
jgi:nicotinamidase-related amidase